MNVTTENVPEPIKGRILGENEKSGSAIEEGEARDLNGAGLDSIDRADASEIANLATETSLLKIPGEGSSVDVVRDRSVGT